MKVTKIYNCNNKLTSHGKNVFKTTEKYLSKFPESYRKCYDKNLQTLEIYRATSLENQNMLGAYNSDANSIIYTSSDALGHEIFHMSSNDMENNQVAFESAHGIENGLEEAMTEYFTMKAYNLPAPSAYDFETFCVMMLEDIPNIFESYFVPKKAGIFDVFPDKRYIYSLMYTMNYYSENIYNLYMISDIDFMNSNPLMAKSIRDIIDSLISIELSLHRDNPEYASKFLDLCGSRFVKNTINVVYPEYFKYAESQIKKRIRK